MYHTLITVEQLLSYSGPLRILDTRHYLDDLHKGRIQYLNGHIPSALFLHLDEDLSGSIISGKTGRHPLPTQDAMESLFSRLGIHGETQVVVYDQGPGAIAARTWWMLQYVGHASVAVLKGGYGAWIQRGLDVEKEVKIPKPLSFLPQPSVFQAVDRIELVGQLASRTIELIDSRDEVRFQGIEEPIDPVAGHIPGAINMPWKGNLAEGGEWLSDEELSNRFETLGNAAVFYCGSGVTACHNILARYHATGEYSVLYPGSWSEWIQYSEPKP